jgi:hypothetical protein
VPRARAHAERERHLNRFARIALAMTPSDPPWTNPTRMAGLSPRAALALLLALLALIGAGLAFPPTTNPGGSPDGGDAALYRQIAARVAHGEDYYQAAATEQRASFYPLKPFTAVRPPALAEAGARLGPTAADLLLWLLAIGAGIATALRVASHLRSPWREAAMLLGATSGILFIRTGMWVWHEAWAGVLVGLALACRTDRHWGISVALGLAAALVRELAFPVLLVMAGAAWAGGSRREACAWIIAAATVLLLLGIHMLEVEQVTRVSDRTSPGWLAFGGWRFDLALARQSSLLIQLPAWVTAIVAPLALLGWAALPGGYGLRVVTLLGLWMTTFLIVGRPDNNYWGFLMAPFLPLGLALAPAALRDLVIAGGRWRPAGAATV